MTDPALQQLADIGDEAQAITADVYDKLSGIKDKDGIILSFSDTVPQTKFSLSDNFEKIEIASSFLSNLRNITDVISIPNNIIGQLHEAAGKLQEKNQKFREILSKLDSKKEDVKIDSNKFVIHDSDGNLLLNLPDELKQFNDICDKVLHFSYLLAISTKDKIYIDFSKARSNAKSQVKLLREALSELNEHINTSVQKSEEIFSIKENVNLQVEEIKRIKSETESQHKTISEYESESTQKVTSIRETHKQAEQLKSQVADFQSDFEHFEKQMNAREEQIDRGNREQNELLYNLKDMQEKIDQLNQQAENMLGGAVVAGLASSFERIRGALDAELKHARYSFYISILVLFVGLIPLLKYVLPEIFGYVSNSNSTIELDIVQVIGRSVLLVPGAWLAKFTADRHAKLFRLKEHYAYKYSLASSVEGFKQQAQTYNDEIAAATFFELTFNPGDKMDLPNAAERHPNPIMDKLMVKMGLTKDGKSE